MAHLHQTDLLVYPMRFHKPERTLAAVHIGELDAACSAGLVHSRKHPGEPEGLVMGTSAPIGPAGKHPQRKWIVPKERQLIPCTPVITPARMVPRLSFTWCNHSYSLQGPSHRFEFDGNVYTEGGVVPNVLVMAAARRATLSRGLLVDIAATGGSLVIMWGWGPEGRTGGSEGKPDDDIIDHSFSDRMPDRPMSDLQRSCTTSTADVVRRATTPHPPTSPLTLTVTTGPSETFSARPSDG